MGSEGILAHGSQATRANHTEDAAQIKAVYDGSRRCLREHV